MDPDNLKTLWQTQPQQPRLLVDLEVLLAEVRRNQQIFAATIMMRDLVEVSVSLLLIPIWIAMGMAIKLPWTWYLGIPGFLWIAGFMIIDRRLHRRSAPLPGGSLREHASSSLADVEHQIWLLRNVAWWYLLPIAAPILVFFIHLMWKLRHGGLSMMFFLLTILVFEGLFFMGVYWLNQFAVRKQLEPRQKELQSLLASLEESPP